jgi:hypothetical protein
MYPAAGLAGEDEPPPRSLLNRSSRCLARSAAASSAARAFSSASFFSRANLSSVLLLRIGLGIDDEVEVSPIAATRSAVRFVPRLG